MISFIAGTIVAFAISLVSFFVCVISYPAEYETPEEFLKNESVFFVGAWIALAIFALPAALIINKLLSHE